MAGYSREKAIDFWFEFDQAFLFDPLPEVNLNFPKAYPNGDLDGLVDQVKQTADEAALASALEPRAEGILALAEIQTSIMRNHFADDADLRSAFEDFGQGVLLDSPGRRPPTRLIHMMDGTPEDWVGYHRWHAFARAAVAVGADRQEWSAIDHMVALAWAIQSEADPAVDSPSNPGLPAARLQVLRDAWMNASDAALDRAFFSYTGDFRMPNILGQVRAPAPEDVAAAVAAAPATTLADVRQMLDAATGSGRPIHSGTGRFWNLPLEEFKAAKVFGKTVVETEGENPGARSAMVRVLRGDLPGFPKMPLRRPPMPEEQIRRIEQWIDDGCPE